MKENIDVTVIVFAYNHETYIRDTILSVINQRTRFHYKILVNDDCSTDNTYNIILSLQKEFPEYIYFNRNDKNIGLNKSFEKAIKLSSSPYIALLAGDDYWISSDKLEKQLNILSADGSVSFVHTSYKSLIEKSGKILNNQNKDWHWTGNSKDAMERVAMLLTSDWSGYPLASSACFRRDVLLEGLKNYYWILHCSLIGEGTMLHFSMCFYGEKYSFINEDMVMYRIRDGSLSHRSNEVIQYKYEEEFFMLKHKIYSELNYQAAKKRLIKKRLINNLFINAIILHQWKQFFQKMDMFTLSSKTKYIFYLKYKIYFVFFLLFRFMKNGIKKIIRAFI